MKPLVSNVSVEKRAKNDVTINSQPKIPLNVVMVAEGVRLIQVQAMERNLHIIRRDKDLKLHTHEITCTKHPFLNKQVLY